MDLQTVSRLSGRSGQIAKLGAFLCFLVACLILALSHTGPGKIGFKSSMSEQRILFAAR